MPMELRSRKLANEDGDDQPGQGERESSASTEDTSEGFVIIKEPGQLQRQRSVAGDEANIAVLLFLYVLQGIPLGLAAAVPLILTNRHVSYREQAEFSFAYWPFSIKLLWAPIVDSCYVASFGRRKTWLVPVQYLIGATMFLLAANVDYYLGDDPSGPQDPDIFSLTCMFFFLNFLAATQDIAVDGWALTMLKPQNVGYASTCNSVGQTAGYFLGYVGYLGLESYGMTTLSGFLYFWSIVFVCATTLVALLKHEIVAKAEDHNSGETGGSDVDASEEKELELDVFETYAMLWKIVSLPLMPVTIFVLLTHKIGFSAADSVTSLKLIEAGVPKDKLAMLAVPMIPVQILMPVVISRYTAGPRPMTVYLRAFVPRLIFGLVFAWFVAITPSLVDAEDGTYHWWYYAIVLVIFALHQVTVNCMFVAMMAFFARISDPGVGGTYMTMLNTLTNLGGNWPATLALWCVDLITVKQCGGENLVRANVTAGNECNGAHEQTECESAGGQCEIVREGYYIESVGCVLLGLAWLAWGWKVVQRLQSADVSDWRVVAKEKARKGKKKERLA